MFRNLRIELVLKQLVAHPEIKKMKGVPKRTLLAYRDIKEPAFWKDTYAVCGVSYPNARLLRLCDKSDAIMGELEHGKRRTTEALEQSAELLSNVDVNQGDRVNDGELAFEEEQIFGDLNEVGVVEEEEEDEVDRSMDLHAKMTWLWGQTLAKLDHDYSVAGFALSVNPKVWEYSSAEDRLDGEVRDAIERIVRKLHVMPNPNSKVRGMDEEEIVDLF